MFIRGSLTQRPTARALTLLTHYTGSYCCVCVYVITNMTIWTLIYDFITVIIGEVVPKLGSAPLHLPYTLENLFKYPFGHLVCMYVRLGNRYAHYSLAWSSAKIIKFACYYSIYTIKGYSFILWVTVTIWPFHKFRLKFVAEEPKIITFSHCLTVSLIACCGCPPGLF